MGRVFLHPLGGAARSRLSCPGSVTRRGVEHEGAETGEQTGSRSGRDSVAGRGAERVREDFAITDDLGRRVVIDSEPKRIVSLAPANTEIVFALGRGDRLVGVTTWCDYPAAAKSLPKVGDFTTPNMEAIAAAKPDLVLLAGGVQADVVKKIESLGAKAVVIDPTSVDGTIERIGTLGAALGARDKAAKVQAAMRAELGDIASRIKGRKAVRAFVEIGVNPLFTVGKGTLLDDELRLAGGENVVKVEGYAPYSTEELVAAQPAVYLGTVSSLGDPEVLTQRPGYGAVRAVAAGRVYSVDDNIVSRGGPRVVIGVRLIAEALHPDAFGK
jgi:iron complex transport system substrate-binding protein